MSIAADGAGTWRSGNPPYQAFPPGSLKLFWETLRQFQFGEYRMGALLQPRQHPGDQRSFTPCSLR
jgi:hypothetical protein